MVRVSPFFFSFEAELGVVTLDFLGVDEVAGVVGVADVDGAVRPEGDAGEHGRSRLIGVGMTDESG